MPYVMFEMTYKDAFKEESFIKVSGSIMSNLIFETCSQGCTRKSSFLLRGCKDELRALETETLKTTHTQLFNAKIKSQSFCPTTSPREKRFEVRRKMAERVKPREEKRKEILAAETSYG